MTLKYILYFLIGGTVISTVTYFASRTKSLLAAFLATMPVITLITFITIYNEVGQQGIVFYAKGLIIMVFPWGMYIVSIIIVTTSWLCTRAHNGIHPICDSRFYHLENILMSFCCPSRPCNPIRQ
jgi:hypothetical protein